jgi:hypothetical protein
MRSPIVDVYERAVAAVGRAQRTRLRAGEVETPEIELRLTLSDTDALARVLARLLETDWSIGKFELLLDAFYRVDGSARRSRTTYTVPSDSIVVEDGAKTQLMREPCPSFVGGCVQAADLRASVERCQPSRAPVIDSGDIASVDAWKWSLRASGRSPSGALRVDASVVFQDVDRATADRRLLDVAPSAIVVEIELPTTPAGDWLRELEDAIANVRGC